MSNENGNEILGPVKRAFERNPLDEPAKTGLQLTDYLGTARTKGQPEHPMARADYRVDAD